jgi:hypothetical protein
MTMTSEEERWFDPGSYGYGPGMPRSWQAWGLCAAYSLVNVAAAWLVVDRSLLGFLAIAAGATILFLATCARWTRTGWRWAEPTRLTMKEKE